MTNNTINTTFNAYDFYKIGDTFHNENGDDYTIVAMDKEKDKTILVRLTEKGTPFYVGVKGLEKHCWWHGHYFLEDFIGASKWYAQNDRIQEKTYFTVEDFIRSCVHNEAGYEIEIVIRKENSPALSMGVIENRFLTKILLQSFIEEWDCDVISIDPDDTDIMFCQCHLTLFLNVSLNNELIHYYNDIKNARENRGE